MKNVKQIAVNSTYVPDSLLHIKPTTLENLKNVVSRFLSVTVKLLLSVYQYAQIQSPKKPIIQRNKMSKYNMVFFSVTFQKMWPMLCTRYCNPIADINQTVAKSSTSNDLSSCYELFIVAEPVWLLLWLLENQICIIIAAATFCKNSALSLL